MTDSLTPDADAPPTADAGARSETTPLRADADAESFDFVPTEPLEAGSKPAPTGRFRRVPVAALGYVGAALAGALLLGGSLFAIGTIGGTAPSPSPEPSLSPTLAPSPSPAPIAAAGPSVGSASAPVTIEVWADYQCPFCQLLEAAFGGSMERQYVLPGLARIVARDFAFLGQESIDAAVAARCAGIQDPGAFWRYHDLLFASQQGENQGTFKRQNLVTLAGVAAVDPTSFTACLDDPAIVKAVADETAQGRALGITSTPTLRVIGPGGTQVLAGLGSGWKGISDAVAAVAAPAPAGSATPNVSAAPGGSATPPASPAAGGGASPSESGAPAASP